MWHAHTNRKPTVVFRLSGLFLLRLAARALAGLLFQEPPRKERAASGAPRRLPGGESVPEKVAVRSSLATRIGGRDVPTRSVGTSGTSKKNRGALRAP